MAKKLSADQKVFSKYYMGGGKKGSAGGKGAVQRARQNQSLNFNLPF